MKQRILLFNTDLELGGTPTVVREIATRLSATGDTDIEVACLAGAGPVADQLRSAGVAVTAFDCTSSGQLFSAVEQLQALVRDRSITTVFSFLIHANTVAALASRKLPGVRFLQSIQTIQPKPRWHWWLQAMIHRRAERIVVPSSVVAEVAEQRCGIERAQIEVIPNAVDPAEFPRVEVFAQPKLRLGYLGRLDSAKSPALLVEALRHLDDPTMELHYFGDGPARFEINGAIVRNGLKSRAFVHGPVAKPQVALKQIDVLCLPSWVEGFGLVLIEAMASGVPVIACDAGGVRDVIVHEENGLLVRDRKHAASEFANCVERLRNDDALRAAIAESGLATVREKFSWDRVIQQYKSLLQVG